MCLRNTTLAITTRSDDFENNTNIPALISIFIKSFNKLTAEIKSS